MINFMVGLLTRVGHFVYNVYVELIMNIIFMVIIEEVGGVRYV